MTTTTVFDQDAFSALEEILGEELDELLRSFIETTPSLLQGLSKAVQEHDHEQLLTVSHTLKGSSGNLAIMEFSRLCGNIEARAKEKQIEKIIPDIDALETEFMNVSNEIETMINK